MPSVSVSVDVGSSWDLISTDPACIVSVSVSENTNRKVNTKIVSMGVVAFDALKRMAFSRL